LRVNPTKWILSRLIILKGELRSPEIRKRPRSATFSYDIIYVANYTDTVNSQLSGILSLLVQI